MDRFAAIEAKRIARLASGKAERVRRIAAARPHDGKTKAWGKVLYTAEHERYGVFLVHETGARTLQYRCETYEQADNEAGRMRDAMTDEQCAEDWNYLPGKIG